MGDNLVVRLISTVLGLVIGAGVGRADNGVGAWESPAANNWPLIAVHAVLTPDGRVLTYGTWAVAFGQDFPAQQTGYFKYDIWNPAAGLSGGHVTLDSAQQTDLFCSSQLIMPESGSIFIAGGDTWNGTGTTNTGNNNSNIFRPSDNTLYRETSSSGPPPVYKNMNRARWYSSSTVLANGEIYIQGGTSGGDRPEVRGAALTGGFRLLSGVDTSSLSTNFPRNFLAPDGRVFGWDADSGRMYYVNTTGTGQITFAGQFSSSFAGWTSSAVMYRPGKIIQMGGNSRGSLLIDITGPQPVVTPVGELMSSQRQWVSATVLADGRVLATGGSGQDNTLNDVNTSAEIWNPEVGPTGDWTVGPSGSRARLYHSGALLLPNGSVLVTGGGAPGPLQNLHSEIYYPSYLYSGPNVFAPRPVISNAPSELQIGVDFSFGIGSADIRRLTFVKTGSVTHSVNMDQRFIELPFTASSGTLFVQMTDKVTDMPPGYYLMFAFNQAGVPSQAKIVRVNIPANPVIEVDYTAVIGGTAGTPFQLACNSDETLVGVYGNADSTRVNRVGAQCVQVDQGGHWIGNPVNRGVTGATTGAAYTKTCLRDSAISGYRGRDGASVIQLDVQCRALTPAGKVTGTPQYLGPVGGTSGTVQGPFSCSTNNPVYMLTGRSGTWVDAFGMQCRTAPITHVGVNTPPSVTNPGNQVSNVGDTVSLQIVATDADIPPDTLTFSATGLPPGLGISTGGLISGSPTTAGTYPVSISVFDGTVSTTANLTWTVTALNPLILSPMPKQPPNVFGTPVTYTATVQNAINPQFKWYFDDGTETGWSSSASVTHAFTRPSIFWVTVSAKDDRGIEQSSTFSQLVHLPLTAAPPAISGQMEVRNSRLWVVNQDNDTVSVFNTTNNQKLAEIAVGVGPRALAFAPDGDVWVTNRHSSNITDINPATLSVRRTISLPFGSQPYGLVFAANGSAAFVALEAAGRILKLDPTTGAETGGAFVGASPRHLSRNADGTRLYVSRFVTPPLPGEDARDVVTENGSDFYGGEVLVLDPTTLGTTSVVVLRHSDDLDFENQGSGIPNYLGPVVISPDGTSAWVPSKKDNIKRGQYRSGGNLTFQNTVRAISSRIDLATNTESFGGRIDHDDASLASAAAFDRYGVFMFVALETSREIAVVNAHDRDDIFHINVGRAPQAVAVSADGYRLYISNFMDRTVGVYDLTALLDEGRYDFPLIASLQSVTTEKLSPTVLAGKQLFYDARDTRLARDRYMSCASCHNDGGSDGRVWDLTGMGEGLRNTVSLRGKAGMGHGFLHWSANFDEVQDFEGQIRALAGGTGLMSDALFNQGTRSQPLGDPKAGLSADLDALAAYLASLNTFAPSPHRNAGGSLTPDGVAGRTIFQNLGCAQCHGGTNFTESAAATLRDVGTIRQPGSGSRLNGPLLGLDPPTLRGVWETAPYLHDGSALTLDAAVRRHNGMSTIADGDLALLVSYLKQIDGSEPAPPAPVDGTNPTVSITTPTSNPTHSVTSTPLSIGGTASDNVGVTQVTWVNDRGGSGTATGTTSWSVSGIVLQSGANVLTVTARDAAGNTATDQLTVTYTPAADGTPPTVTITTPTSNPTHGVSTTPLSMGGTASDNVGVTQVTWVNDRGGSGTATGTTSWSVSGIVLLSGQNVLTVTARDAAGNTSTDQLTVTYTPPDTTNPTVSITTPTVNPTHSVTATPLSIGGTASDNVAVTQVTWSNDRGGSGTATGTTSWTVSGIVLQSGANVLTVTARDAAGNTSTDTLTVTYTPPAPSAGLVAAYAFDEGVGMIGADASGNANTATLTNGPLWTSGKNGGALQFDGVNDLLRVNDADALDLSLAATFETWVYPTVAPSGWRTILQKEVDAYFFSASSGSAPAIGGTFNGVCCITLTAPAALPVNTWTHLAASYDGAQIRLYVNGVQVTAIAASGSYEQNANPLWIGGSAVYGEHFQGKLDDIRIYNRALSAAEIQTDMTLPVGGTPPADGTAPLVTITTPTSAATHTASATPLSLGGTASDNVGVTQVTWSNDRGGSGTATGTTSWTVSGIVLLSGQNVLTVTARDAAGNTSTDTLTVSYTPPDTTLPTVTITTPTSAATHTASATPLSLGGTASDNVGVTQVTWSNDRGGSGTATGTTSWTVSGIVLLSGQNVLTVTARDAAGNTSTDTLTVTYTPADTTLPTVTITTPTSAATHTASATPLSLGGTASDNVGVTQVTWSNDRGGSGTATGTTSWTVSGIVLLSGQNVLTVTARDAAGNTSTDTLTVTYTPPDTTLPTVTITTPTSAATHTASATPLSLGGTASDNVGVTQVTWSNDRGGSGTATGTTSWTVSGIVLLSGQNVLMVTARDAAGNTSTDTLTVSYTPPDTTLPTVTITTPTSAATHTASATPLSLGGTASDNVGVTQVTWVNDRGGSGTATGTTSWTVSGIVLLSGQNVLTVTARDAAGNTSTDTLTVTYTPPDTTLPTVTITTPTSAATHTASATPLSLGGTASDNVGVTQVTWSNDRGGSGTATGTTSWTVSGIVLLSGQNVLTVTARDAAGNTSTDTLTVTYTPPDTTLPTVTITTPTSAATHTASATPLSLGGTASDNVGVTQVTWSNDRGGSGTATGTTSWTVSGIVLLSGQNVLMVTARDAAGNTSTDTLTVSYTPPDTTLPTVTITTPTSAATHTASATPLSLGGTASDNVGVTQVTWSNDRGGSGTATGTTSWSVSGIVLLSGQNVLTVTARDAAGNTSTDTLTVTYAPADTAAPVVTITAPTGATKHSTTVTPMSLGGTASDNVGVTQVTWSNDRGGSGTATGTTSWTVSGIALLNGQNVLTVTARDAAGNTSTDQITVSYKRR